MINEAALEQRLEDLEHAVAELQQQLVGVSVERNWLDQVTGSISDEQAFLEALEYGRTFRHGDRPPDDPSEQP
jgi:hypothetical protein